MKLRYLGFTSYGDFWCYGVATDSHDLRVTHWRQEYQRCHQSAAFTDGTEIWIAWGKTQQLDRKTFHIKRARYNHRFHQNLKNKSRSYTPHDNDKDFVQKISAIMDEERSYRTLMDSNGLKRN